MLNGWTEVKSYRDDGYSGGNFQRPGFLEMLEDARHGLINLILVKDCCAIMGLNQKDLENQGILA